MSARDDVLLAVERAAAKVQAAQLELEQAMRAASDAGVTLRPLAQAAGLGVETARRRLAKVPS